MKPISYQSREIKSFHPLNIAINGVYYDDEKSEDCLIRIPVLGLAIYDLVTYRESSECPGRETDEDIISREKGLIGYLSFSPDSYQELDCEAGNLLGYELDGKERDWTREIQRYKKKEQRRAEKK